MTAFYGLLGAGVFLAALAAVLAACGLLRVTLARPARKTTKPPEVKAP